MAKKKKEQPPQTVPPEIVRAIVDDFQTQVEEQMGHLHNQFVAFISESRVPLPQVVMVLQMLLKEAADQAFAKYLGTEG